MTTDEVETPMPFNPYRSGSGVPYPMHVNTRGCQPMTPDALVALNHAADEIGRHFAVLPPPPDKRPAALPEQVRPHRNESAPFHRGDRVKVLSDSRFQGHCGIVTREPRGHSPPHVMVRLDGQVTDRRFRRGQLKGD